MGYYVGNGEMPVMCILYSYKVYHMDYHTVRLY